MDLIIHKDYLFKDKQIDFEETAAILMLSNGDARKLCNMLEMIGCLNETNIKVNDALVTKLVQENPAIYDKDGEMHYDLASAFIKSIRGSDPNAALYWMARMIEEAKIPVLLSAECIFLQQKTSV